MTDSSSAVRRGAVLALVQGGGGTPETMALLFERLRDRDFSVRQAAGQGLVEVLGQRGDYQELLRVLEEMRTHRDRPVRRTAVETLERVVQRMEESESAFPKE